MRALLKRMVIVEPQSILETALLLLSAFQLLSAVRTEHGKSDLEFCIWLSLFGIFAKLDKFYESVRLCTGNGKNREFKADKNVFQISICSLISLLAPSLTARSIHYHNTFLCFLCLLGLLSLSLNHYQDMWFYMVLENIIVSPCF